MNYDPDAQYFRELDQQTQSLTPAGDVILSGSVPAWLCDCFHWNGVDVPRCNNCGEQKPCMALVPYNPRFKYGWGYVADCSEQALINQCKKLGAGMAETTEIVREAIRLLEAA